MIFSEESTFCLKGEHCISWMYDSPQDLGHVSSLYVAIDGIYFSVCTVISCEVLIIGFQNVDIVCLGFGVLYFSHSYHRVVCAVDNTCKVFTVSTV